MSLIQSADIWQNYTVKFPHSVEELMEAEFPANNKFPMQRKRWDSSNWSVNEILKFLEMWSGLKRKSCSVSYLENLWSPCWQPSQEKRAPSQRGFSFPESCLLNLCSRIWTESFEDLFLFCLFIFDPTTGPHHYKEASAENLTKDITDRREHT